VIRIRNRVLPLLFAAAALGVAGGGFVAVAPNRLLSGEPVGLFAACDWRLSLAIVALGMALLATAAMPPRPGLYRMASLSAAALLLLVMAAAGEAALSLRASVPALARISLGAAFWVLAGAVALSIIDLLQRAGAGNGARLMIAAIVIAGFAIMAYFGLFDALSLAREYRTREASFAAALLRHVELVMAAVGMALLIGFPLGIVGVRHPQWQGPVFAVLNLLQTIPSIALFGLLIVPLSALAVAAPFLAELGIAGIGPAPAIIALILYALLPVVRNMVAGIEGVDPAIVDAARGIGMDERQIFRQVQLPLAAPLLLAGLRIVTVQTIGLAVVAALIGAGGLGTFVFAGLGQYAADLVLLGALPTIALALAADFLLQFLTAAVR
jgi:osmoprotectant transport system permease protein